MVDALSRPVMATVPALATTGIVLVPAATIVAPESRAMVPKLEYRQTWPFSATVPAPPLAALMVPEPPANSMAPPEAAPPLTAPMNTALGSTISRLPLPVRSTA